MTAHQVITSFCSPMSSKRLFQGTRTTHTTQFFSPSTLLLLLPLSLPQSMKQGQTTAWILMPFCGGCCKLLGKLQRPRYIFPPVLSFSHKRKRLYKETRRYSVGDTRRIRLLLLLCAALRKRMRIKKNKNVLFRWGWKLFLLLHHWPQKATKEY